MQKKISDKLYFRREYAQSNVKLETTVDTMGRTKSNRFLNAEKISDTTRQYLQNKEEFRNFSYDVLFFQAEKELAPVFERFSLNNPVGQKEEKLFNKKKRIAISNWIEGYIRKNFPTVLRVDFDEFIQATSIVEAKRSVNEALRALDNAQTSNYYEVEHLRLNLETGEIETGISKVNALPVITLWLDEEMEGKGYTLSSFADVEIKNKKDLIKGLEIEFSSMFLYHVIGIGNDYVYSMKSKRDRLKHTASHKLDILFSSLYNIRHNQKAVTFTVPELKDFLGVPQGTEYKYFNRDTLSKCIKDIGREMNKIIIPIPHKKGRKVESITFQLKYEEIDEQKKFTADYIASQLKYFSNTNIENIRKFSMFIQSSEIEPEKMFGHKSFAQWEKEAEEAFKKEKEILKMFEEDELFFKKNSVVYDRKKHTILKSHVFFEDGEEKTKWTLISKNNKRIINPVDSFSYLVELEVEVMSTGIHIMNYIPFAYFRNGVDWIEIDSIDTLTKYQEVIDRDILLQKVDSFGIRGDIEKELFTHYVKKNMFMIATKGLKEKIVNLFNRDSLFE